MFLMPMRFLAEMPCEIRKKLFMDRVGRIIDAHVVPRELASSDNPNPVDSNQVEANPHTSRIQQEHQYILYQHITVMYRVVAIFLRS